MSTIADAGYPTLNNLMRRLAPNGSVESNMAELLSKKIDILEDIPWVEGNLPTGHRITSRTGLPSPTWRKLNQGLDPVKSTSAQYDESCGMLEAYSKVDVDVASLNGNEAAFRASEDKAFLEAIGQELASSVFYASVLLAPEEIHGLSPRYAATTGYTASSYVTKGTVSGTDAQSVWLINWEPNRIYGIYPKGSMAGLKQTDMGIQLVNDSDSKQFRAYTTHYQWKCGVAVQDYRYARRHQWDPGDTTDYADTAKGLYLKMQAMLSEVYDLGPGARFYMNRTSFAKLMAQLAANSANFLEYVEAGKRRVPSFLGVPIRVTDALVAESAIS